MNDNIAAKGFVNALIEYKDGKNIELAFPNVVLRTGREALVKTLTNSIGTEYTNLFVTRMIFGDGGTLGGQVRIVDAAQAGLFGITRASKAVIGQVNPNNLTQAIFTSVLTYDDANGYTLNEMALVLNDASLYSMVTFADLTKTSNMQITWNWSISLI
jgi:hypothetical protein